MSRARRARAALRRFQVNFMMTVPKPFAAESARSGIFDIRIFEGERFRLADAIRDRVRHGFRQIELDKKILLSELVEQRAFAAPEDVDPGLALPLDDLTVCDRRARGESARLDCGSLAASSIQLFL